VAGISRVLTRDHCEWTERYPLATASKRQLRFDLRLIAQNHVQQGTVDFNLAVVINKAQLPKFVHEKTDARSRRADQRSSLRSTATASSPSRSSTSSDVTR
jgi:hypothetical protein